MLELTLLSGVEVMDELRFGESTLRYIRQTTPELQGLLVRTRRGPLYTLEAVELVRQRDEEIRASGRGRPRKARAMVV